MLNHQFSTATIALDRNAHQWASQFAAQQTTVAKGQRVYLNTLAVCAVKQYLSQVCAIDIKVEQGDCWQVGLQTVIDVADLIIPQVGRLECRPVPPGATAMFVPPTLHNDVEGECWSPMGYVAVRLAEDLNTAELLGFVTNPHAEWIPLDQLAPVENLLENIYARAAARIENLRHWLDGQLGDWQPVDQLIHKVLQRRTELERDEYQVVLRSYLAASQVAAGKIINLQANIANIPLLLLIGLNQEADGRINVKTRLHSAGMAATLPANLQLILQDKDGQCLREVCHAQAMDFIQLQSFKLRPGTEFKIQVTLGSSSLTESFIA
jgi:Protein of unknown function (DUF1822)